MKNVLTSQLETIEEKIKTLAQSENYYNLGQAEPIFKSYYKEVSFEANETNFNILDLVEMGKVYKTIEYSNVESIEIDSILVTLHLKNGEIYCLQEIRDDIAEILSDFEDNCMITKYKKCIIDGELKHKTKYYIYIEDFEVFNDEEENTITVKGEDSTYVLDYSDILSVEEQYDGMHRIVRLNMVNYNELITIESM